LLFAESLLKKEQWIQSIGFYEYWLKKTAVTPNAFLELSLVYINCLKAYANLLSTNNEQTICAMVIADEQQQGGLTSRNINEENWKSEDAKNRMIELFNKAEMLLNNELFMIDNRLERAKLHINYGYVYRSLMNIALEYKLATSFNGVSELNDKAKSQFQKAVDLLKNQVKDNTSWFFSPDNTECNELMKQIQEKLACANNIEKSPIDKKDHKHEKIELTV